MNPGIAPDVDRDVAAQCDCSTVLGHDNCCQVDGIELDSESTWSHEHIVPEAHRLAVGNHPIAIVDMKAAVCLPATSIEQVQAFSSVL